jgi:pyrroloquinoline quinone biosynthesis protein B
VARYGWRFATSILPFRFQKCTADDHSVESSQAFDDDVDETHGVTVDCVFVAWQCVLGIAQDAGYPQAGCRKGCCEKAWNDPALRRHATCLAIVDPESGQRWLIECTPDFPKQLHQLDAIAAPTNGLGIDGIFLTHAHIGHYTGLMHLGREVIGAGSVPVFAMPRMKQFLRSNGPWSQLVTANNIHIRELLESRPEKLNHRIRATPR